VPPVSGLPSVPLPFNPHSAIRNPQSPVLCGLPGTGTARGRATAGSPCQGAVAGCVKKTWESPKIFLDHRPIKWFYQTVKTIFQAPKAHPRPKRGKVGKTMDMRNPANSGRDAPEPPGGLRLQPIVEYLRHVSRDDDADARGVLLSIPRKLYRVSEIAHHLDITRQTVHNYATIGLITEEQRTPGGQRLFDESVFSRLAEIQRLKLTHRLNEIRRIFERQERRGPRTDDTRHASGTADTFTCDVRDPQPKDT